MAERATNTQAGLQRQREIWWEKRALRLHYTDFYDRIIRWLPDGDQVYEIGCGSGNFKQYYPSVIATDLFDQPWVDRVLSTESLVPQLGQSRVDALVMIDVIHHITNPLGFLKDAALVLRPGGRVIMVEPYISKLLGRVYGGMHHEAMDLEDDLAGPRPAFDPQIEYANQAVPRLLYDFRDEWFSGAHGGFRLVHSERFAGLLYMLSGGFNYRNLIPYHLHRALKPIEDVIIRVLPAHLALRVLMVLEKPVTEDEMDAEAAG